MPRLLCLSALLAVATASAAPVPVVPHDPTKDREGNPLPRGATARLGSLAYRGPATYWPSFSLDGKKFLSAAYDGRVFAWDADTGKPLPTRTFGLPREPYNWAAAVAGDRVVWLGMPFSGDPRDEPLAVVYDLAGGEVSRFALPAARRDVVATPDGKYLATVADGARGSRRTTSAPGSNCTTATSAARRCSTLTCRRTAGRSTSPGATVRSGGSS